MDSVHLPQVKLQPIVLPKEANVLLLSHTQNFCLRMVSILIVVQYSEIFDHLQEILATISGLGITVVVTATTLQAPRRSRES